MPRSCTDPLPRGRRRGAGEPRSARSGLASRFLRRVGLRSLCLLWVWPLTSAADDFSDRLQKLSDGVDAYVAAQPDDAGSRRFPAALRRVAWVQLNGDRRADAVVVLKARKSECAVTAEDRRVQCRALVLVQADDGSFRVAFDFPLLWHPLLVQPQGPSPPQIYLTESSLEEPVYSQFALSGSAFVSTGKTLSRLQARESAVLEFDDRSMPLIEAEKVAAANPGNARAGLSPYTLLIDNINPGTSITELVDRSMDEQLLPQVLSPFGADLAQIVAGIGWPMMLDVRLLGCPDWPVPRRFWEVEGVRNGKLGICVSGIAFWDAPTVRKVTAARKIAAPVPADRIDALRYRLLHEVGVAYLLRAEPMSVNARLGLRSLGQRRALTLLGAATGVLIGLELKLQTVEQAQRAHALWDATAQLWFELFEAGQHGWTSPTPELQAFAADLQDRKAGLECAKRVVAKAATAGPCPEPTWKILRDLPAHLRSARPS